MVCVCSEACPLFCFAARRTSSWIKVWLWVRYFQNKQYFKLLLSLMWFWQRILGNFLRWETSQTCGVSPELLKFGSLSQDLICSVLSTFSVIIWLLNQHWKRNNLRNMSFHSNDACGIVIPPFTWLSNLEWRCECSFSEEVWKGYEALSEHSDNQWRWLRDVPHSVILTPIN